MRANPSEAERENGVQVSPVTVNRGNAEAEKRGAGLQRTESGTVSRGGFPTESGSESASGEKEGGWRAAAKAAVAEKKKRFEKLLEQKDGKTKSAS